MSYFFHIHLNYVLPTLETSQSIYLLSLIIIIIIAIIIYPWLQSVLPIVYR